LRKSEKNNSKNQTIKKPIKILKNSTGAVRFWFYKPETEKTESNQTQAKKKSEKNRAKPEKPS